MKVDIKVGGLERLDRVLRQLPVRIERRVLQSAVTSAVRVGRAAIKRSAPKGRDVSSVQKKYGYGKLNKELRVIRLKRTKKNEKMARVDTGKAFWALFYEKGTRHQPARPFFAKAFEGAEGKMIQKLSERIKEGIEREVRKIK
jgi:HK97 gp10 family phage protein